MIHKQMQHLRGVIVGTLLLACHTTAAPLELELEPQFRTGNQIQALVDAAIKVGCGGVVTVPPGEYQFEERSSLQIYSGCNLTVTAEGAATLWFECGFGVHIANSSEVRFIGFTIDYRTACFAQGKVPIMQTIHSGRNQFAPLCHVCSGCSRFAAYFGAAVRVTCMSPA